MVFSSTIFIFLFLPIVVGIYFVIPKALKNLFLLAASLVFYTWGEHFLVLLMIASISINYSFGIGIDYVQKHKSVAWSKVLLVVGVTTNLLILGYYKYASFLVENLSQIGVDLNVDTSSIRLPIGISFFTFQGLSYLVDVYRKAITPQRSIVNLGMYIALFPQLVAGPIVRCADIEEEITSRKVTIKGLVDGVSRFIIGFSKKVLIANNLGVLADHAFELQHNELSTSVAWLGIACYSFQIFFDFSGYSDMAIGLGKMFGFTFKENFNYPYYATSIKEFWRRWHISLSTWFRDYLYIPLGGNRRGVARTYMNLLIVFFLTGLWHGASWNFIVWGLFHGAFLIVERNVSFSFPKILKWVPWLYTMIVVVIGWVFFRSEDLSSAVDYLDRMFVLHAEGSAYPFIFLDTFRIAILVVALVLSFPIYSVFNEQIKSRIASKRFTQFVRAMLLIVIFILSIMEMSQSTYNPFIYYRF